MSNNIIRILAVEDEPLNQMMLKFLFKEANVESEVVGTGGEALHIMDHRHDEFHVVFMDLGLPDMCGIQVTQKIRENENIKERTPKFICAYTGTDTPEKKQECLEAGMNAFLAKPMSIEKLQGILQKLGFLHMDSQAAIIE